MINSADLYLDITQYANATPAWVRVFAEIGTDAGMGVFFALFAWRWWRVRTLANLLAPLGVVFAYGISELSKTFIQEDRPCRAIGAPVIADCPPIGDWSFPSNHATTAAACAAALTLIWRRTAWLVVPLAALMAFSRVFVGVHYPHDVAAGVLLGVAVAAVTVLVIQRRTAPPPITDEQPTLVLSRS